MIKKIALGIVLVILAAAISAVVWMAIANPGMQGDSTPPEIHQNNASNNPGATPGGPQSEVTVNIKNSSFTPPTITIKKGGTVTWVNDDTIRHNVIAKEAGNAAGLPTHNELFGKGGTYKFTFNETGTFDYLCEPHPFMTGTVKVIE